MARKSAGPNPRLDQFAGFPEGGYEFFLELQANQSRDWFMVHKDDYERLWARPMRALGDELAAGLTSTYPQIGESRPHVFRIQRDVRFSADKSPYKTHTAMSVAIRPGPTGMDDPEGGGVPALYVHFGLDDDVLAGGRWQLGKAALERYRAAVDHPVTGTRLQEVMQELQALGFRPSSHESLKRVPPPFAQDHPRGELLKLKGVAVARTDVPEDLMRSRALLDWMVEQFRSLAGLVGWLDTALPNV